jgi:PPK2 family polyphosphate:nucleotide phosphotransferase
MNRYRVKPDQQVDLSRWDADDGGDCPGGKNAASEETEQLNGRLEALQELLYAEHKHKVLLILQGMDTSGKDGVIRHVFDGVNPQGVRVACFKVPTPAELDHDYLWRVHPHTPGRGEMVIFNRSHYEDVLVVRVHQIVAEETWRRRYRHICEFERLLADEGATILKFYLHIDQAEQKRRLQARLADSSKQWKFNPADLEERKRWADYRLAYEEALAKTSADHAPWYVVPANRKWYRDLVISRILVETLEGLKMSFPKPAYDPAKIVVE